MSWRAWAVVTTRCGTRSHLEGVNGWQCCERTHKSLQLKVLLLPELKLSTQVLGLFSSTLVPTQQSVLQAEKGRAMGTHSRNSQYTPSSVSLFAVNTFEPLAQTVKASRLTSITLLVFVSAAEASQTGVLLTPLRNRFLLGFPSWNPFRFLQQSRVRVGKQSLAHHGQGWVVLHVVHARVSMIFHSSAVGMFWACLELARYTADTVTQFGTNSGRELLKFILASNSG